jgi:uncharacterized protein (TIGR00255 family)
MTGYAWQEADDGKMSVSVEIKGYNSRFLDISLNAPTWLSGLEAEIRSLVSLSCGRGRVDVSVRVRENDVPVNVTVNTKAAAAYMKAINDLCRELKIADKVSIKDLINREGVLQTEKSTNAQSCWNSIKPVLTQSLTAFAQERAREGKHTENDILEMLGKMEAALRIVADNAAAMEETIKENIGSRFKEISGGNIDENRVLTETAVLLMKYTVSEELSRLSSHIGEFRAETARNTRPGKKLDFLCQEMNREVNTIGSKSTVAEVSRAVVEMKEALENIREQLRNVE